MREAVAVAKEADRKQEFSPGGSDNSIHRVRDEPERQLGSLRGVIGSIRRDGGTPSVGSIATQLGGVSIAQRAPALLVLQQTHGNRYVQRVVSGIQAKLKIGQPGDIYEEEADRVADAVMRMSEPQVQRQLEEEKEEDEKELIQTKPLAGQITPLAQRQSEEGVEPITMKPLVQRQADFRASHSLERRLVASQRGGSPLPAEVRSFMEPRFGVDFRGVRVHTDSGAVQMNRELNAQAFTSSHDVYFGAGRYDPHNTAGKRLLAHELTHVLQQGNGPTVGGVQRTPVLVQRVVNEEERRAASLLVGELQIEIAGIERMMEQHQDSDNEEEELHYSLWASAVEEMISALRALARGEEREDGRQYLGQSVAQLVQEAERSVGEAAAGESGARESEVDLAQLETALRIQIAHAVLAHDSGIHRGDADAAARASLVQGFLAEKLELVRRMIRGDAAARRELGSLRGAPGDIIQRWVRAAAAGLQERVPDLAIEEEMVILQRRVADAQRRLERLERLLELAETIYRSAMAEGATMTVLIEGLATLGRAVGALRNAATAPVWLMAVRVINVHYNVYGGIWAPGRALAMMREYFSRIAQYREVFAQFMATRDDLEQNRDIVFLMERGLDGVRDEATAVADEMEDILARLSELAVAE